MNTDHFTCHCLDALAICLDVKLRHLHDGLLAGKIFPPDKGRKTTLAYKLQLAITGIS